MNGLARGSVVPQLTFFLHARDDILHLEVELAAEASAFGTFAARARSLAPEAHIAITLPRRDASAVMHDRQ